MGPTRRAAWQAGAVVALADAWALRRAWGSVGERLAVAAVVAAIVVGAALALAPWLEALGSARRGRAMAAAVAGAFAVALPLATTATAVRLVGTAAATVLATVAIAGVLAATARAPRLVAAIAGTLELVALAEVPRRLYPGVRATLLLTAFVALARALRRAPADAADGVQAPAASTAAPSAARPRSWPALALGVALVAGGAALSRLDANVRFVTHAQAPAASLVLDAVERLQAPPDDAEAREPERLAAATRPAAAAREPGGGWPARFAHDGALDDAHLLLVTVDALRADRLARMPALAALAARGVTFTHAYAAAPSTAASITALMTARPPGRLDDRPPTLAERLRAAGWNTEDFYPAGLFYDGGGALAPYAASHFGVAWADTRTQPAEALTDAALARMERAATHGEPRSFFWLHYFDPHEPYEPHELPRSAPPIERYDAEVRAVDRALARLVDGLSAFARPTLVVVTADHGEEFGEHGGAYHGSSLYDEQLRVPLVVALVGGRTLVPERVETPVSLVDLLPAIAALLDAPVFHERATSDLFATVDTHHMILRGSWKLVRDARRDVDELYDLAADPGEQHNLAAHRRDVAAPLAAALEAWIGAPSVATLVVAVADRARPPAVRAAAARELGAREAYAGAAALRAALADDDATVRTEAALALAALTDAQVRAPLQALLASADAALADRAAVMLGRLRDPAAAARLAAICRRPPAEGDRAAAAVQRDAAHYLGFVGDAGAVDALFSAAADPRVRGTAWLAVGRIAARTTDARAAARLRAQLAVEDRADARADLLAAVAQMTRVGL